MRRTVWTSSDHTAGDLVVPHYRRDNRPTAGQKVLGTQALPSAGQHGVIGAALLQRGMNRQRDRRRAPFGARRID